MTKPTLCPLLVSTLALALHGCSDDSSLPDAATKVDGARIDADAIVDADANDVSVTDVSVTDVPVTDVPITDVPVTDVPVTDVAVQDVRPVTDATPPAGTVRVCGMDVPVAGSWSARGGRVYYGSDEVRVWGLNWFGLETPDRAPHGLWARPLEEFVAQVASLGFTALRVPVSPQSIRAGFSSASWSQRGAIDTGREQLDALLNAADARGLRVLLDFHTCDPGRLGGSLPGSPIACSGYGLDGWLADLRELAAIAALHPRTVLGIDLANEPHDLTWTAWRDLATQGARAVLCANPRVLVFVEGVGNASNNAGFDAFWGENLTEAARLPVDAPPERLVYSPHVYGPSVARMRYFSASDYPRNLPPIWNAHFGHLVAAGANVVMGEFCGWYDDGRASGDVAWQDAMVAWMGTRPVRGFFDWALNPNAGDTGGILQDDWRTPNAAKLRLLAPLMR